MFDSLSVKYQSTNIKDALKKGDLQETITKIKNKMTWYQTSKYAEYNEINEDDVKEHKNDIKNKHHYKM